MENKIMEANHVSISGIITTDFQTICTAYGKKYYILYIKVRRLSGNIDIIPVVIPDRLIESEKDYRGRYVCVMGRYCSRNYYEQQKRRLKLYIYAGELEIVTERDRSVDDNCIFLDGYLCKEPVYRITPLKRSITDMLIAVNGLHGKTDYIPCICWGKAAYYASSLCIGSHVGVEGRVQSREYYKRLNSMESEKRTAYEISVSKLKIENFQA